MISPEEGRRAVIVMGGKYFVLEPELGTWGYRPITDGEAVPEGFHCSSDKNDLWYSAEDIRKVLETGI